MDPESERTDMRWKMNARDRRRAELRRAARDEHPAMIALDADHLLQLASAQDSTSKGHTVRTALVVRALVAARFTRAEIAAAWNMTPAQVDAAHEVVLIDKTGIAAAIEAQLAAEYPDVYVAPPRTAAVAS